MCAKYLAINCFSQQKVFYSETGKNCFTGRFISVSPLIHPISPPGVCCIWMDKLGEAVTKSQASFDTGDSTVPAYMTGKIWLLG